MAPLVINIGSSERQEAQNSRRLRRTVNACPKTLFDHLAEQFHPVPCIVVLANVSIHKGEAMESRRRQWAKRRLYLYYLPPYSPERNRIEIL